MTTGNKFETRVVSEKIEIRAAADGKGRTLSGYAARFDIKSGVIAGSFREIIRAGAFRDTLGGGVDAQASTWPAPRARLRPALALRRPAA